MQTTLQMAEVHGASLMMTNLLESAGDLLRLLGWWVMFALTAGACSFFGMNKDPSLLRRKLTVPAAILLGVLLPVCNYTAAPLTVSLLASGMGQGPAAAFLVAASLLNPGAILLAWAYLGPLLAVVYLLFGLAASFAAGSYGTKVSCNKASKLQKASYLPLAGRVCFWTATGVIVQSAVTVWSQPLSWKLLLSDPGQAGVMPVLAAALTRMICIPDDVALVASLTACGLGPGFGMLLLLCGALCNIPQCLTVAAVMGKDMLKAYLLPLTLIVPGCLLLQTVIGPSFVPQYSLHGTEALVNTANRLTVHTPMAARSFFAALLLTGAACFLLSAVRKRSRMRN